MMIDDTVGDRFCRDCSEKVCLRSSALKVRIAGKTEETANEKAWKGLGLWNRKEATVAGT